MKPRRKASDWKKAPESSAVSGVASEWDAAVASFLRDARARNCSPASLDNYRQYLIGPRARQFLADYSVQTPADVTPAKLRSGQADLLDAGLSPGTVATFHRIMRNFLGFCHRDGWSIIPKTLETVPPRQPLVEPETFTDGEISALLLAAATARDRFLIQFMLKTGLRLQEVAAVTLDDLISGPEGHYLRVRQGKGRKDRIVPLDTGKDRFSRRVDTYIKNVRPKNAKDRHLFLSTRMDPLTHEYPALTFHSIKVICKRLAEKTGIHTHAHKFRHTFATKALAAGVDSLVLQRALGHTTLAMVNRYVHFQSGDLIRAWMTRSD
jgi:site-specific recombinase XerD